MTTYVDQSQFDLYSLHGKSRNVEYGCVDGELLVLLVRIAAASVDAAAWHFLAPTMRDVRGCEKRVH